MAARAEANEKENARYSKYERDIFGLGIIRRKLIKGRKYPILTIPSEEYATKSHDVYERNLDRGAAFSETAGGKATTIEPKMDTMSSFIMDNVFSDQTASIEQANPRHGSASRYSREASRYIRSAALMKTPEKTER